MTWQKRWAVVRTTPKEIQKAVEYTLKGIATWLFSLSLLDVAQNLKQPTGEEDPPPAQESNVDK